MRPPNSVRAVARVSAMALALIVLVTVSIGWCYWLRGLTSNWPGPRITDALPLDELPGNSSISLLVFTIVVALGGVCAGKLSKALHFDGFAIALSVGLAVGAWVYLTSAISIFIVRQIPLDLAFDSTRDLQPAYVAGALFSLGVAFTARRPSGDQWLTRIIPSSVGILGVISMLIAALPNSVIERVALGGLFTGPSAPFTRTVEIVIGIVLLICARGLTRRSRRALMLASVLIFILSITRVIDGFNIVALIVDIVVLASLLARRSDFSYRGDPTTRATPFLRFSALALAAIAYGVVTLIINRTAASLPVHPLVALRVTLLTLVIGAPRQSSIIGGGFAEWFPWSLRAIVGMGIVWGVSPWFAPWRQRFDDGPDSRRQAARLVNEWGVDTLAPFTLRGDKAPFFFPGEQKQGVDQTTMLAYRVVRGVAIVSGDPIGPTDQIAGAIAAFRSMCAARGWRVAILGASDRYLDLYREQGLRPLYHGDEAIIDVERFTLVGNNMKSVRQASQRVDRKGYRAEIFTAGQLSPEVRAELCELEQRWLAGKPRKGFIMELDELFRLDGDDAVFVIGRDPNDELVGFLDLAVCRSSSSLSLSSMPRSSDTPNGFNAFLIVALIEWASDHDFSAVSLNFSPAARLFRSETEVRGWMRLTKRVLLIIKSVLGLQLDDLLIFNRHFGPRWQPRYIVVERYRYLPRIVIASMAAERYLPFAKLLRGRDWKEPTREVGALPVYSR